MPLGCLLWAGGYAAAGLAAPRPLKMAISYLACVTALGAAWFAHAALAAAPTLFTPLFFYEYGWSPAQVLQTLLVVALPMAVLPHLVRLTPKDE
jgi:hypothetical protein